MNFKTYYIRVENEEQLWQGLQEMGLAKKQVLLENEEPQWVYTGNGALDIIGTIYKPTGNMITDENGFEYPEMTSIEGFHANLLEKPDLIFPNYINLLEPKTPCRVFG